MKNEDSVLQLLQEFWKESVEETKGQETREDPQRGRKRNNRARNERDRAGPRARQLCAQARRALELILPDLMVARGVYTAQVCELVPYPDASRLLLVVTARFDELDRTRALAEELGGRLRSELAQAIHRKRAPDLVLEVWTAPEADPGVGND